MCHLYGFIFCLNIRLSKVHKDKTNSKLSLAIFCSFIIYSVHTLSTHHRTSIHRSVRDEKPRRRGDVSLRAEMAAAPTPCKADTSSASLPLLLAALLLARQLCVVVIIVFEVARGAAAGALTLTDRLQLVLLRLTAIVLHRTHPRTQCL